MAVSSVLRCADCSAEADLDLREFTCSCGGLFDVEHRDVAISTSELDQRFGSFDAPDRSGVWRFWEAVHPTLPKAEVASLDEGRTPLAASDRVAEFVGLPEVHLKHEGMNPTGSFKDRGMTVAVSQARRTGAQRVVCASTGNTAASMSAFASIAGMEAVVLVPEGATALGKLSQSVAYGARVVRIQGDFDAGMSLVREHSEELGLYVVNSLNPFRVEGQKTIVFDMLQQLRWNAPDWFVFPAGNLGNAAAFGKALREAVAFGWIERAPRLLAVQASGAAPFEASYRDDFKSLKPVQAETLATAIKIGAPVSFQRAVRSIRETNGVVLAATDAEILEAKAVVDAAGLGAEPASCASVAGLAQAVAKGIVKADERCVCLLTGNLLKDPEATLGYHEGSLAGIESKRANRPVTAPATRDGLASALEG